MRKAISRAITSLALEAYERPMQNTDRMLEVSPPVVYVKDARKRRMLHVHAENNVLINHKEFSIGNTFSTQ